MQRVPLAVIACAMIGLVVTAWAFVRERRLHAVGVQAVSGELVTYEASRQDLTLHTDSGDQHFRLRDDTPVHEGARTVMRADLASARGCPAKVWYRDTGGTWIASDVRISCRRLEPHADPTS